MKANELMIGDWVNIYVFPNDEPKGDALFPARINAILSDSEDVECRFSLNGEGKVGYASRPAGTCLPIPLTPEILEKNGFECRGAWCLPGEDMGLRQDGDTWAVLSHYGMYTSIPFCRISYIHQLQHALRLCGIEKEITL